MISIGGVELNPKSDMVWRDRFVSYKAEQLHQRTLGNRLVVMTGSRVGGRPITLEATAEYGWQRKSVVDQLIELADVEGGVYAFIFGAESYSILLDSSNGPAVDMRPNFARVAQGLNDYMQGQIKMVTV